MSASNEDFHLSLRRLDGSPGIALRNLLRDARSAALANAEAAGPLFVAFDQLGKFLNPKGQGLGDHLPYLRALARRSPLFAGGSSVVPSFESLFAVVRSARNDAVHQGVYARHLTRYALELAMILEDALMSERLTIGEYMVRAPVVAESWQPLSLIRQHMIENSFTFLPVHTGGSWFLLDDESLAAALRGSASPIKGAERARRLAMSVDEALSAGLLRPVEPGARARPDDSVVSVCWRSPRTAEF